MKRRGTVWEDTLDRLRCDIAGARARLEESRHPLQAEAAAYELKYLEARRAYLLELARAEQEAAWQSHGSGSPQASG